MIYNGGTLDEKVSIIMLYHKTIDDNIIIFVEINKTITYFENEIVIIRFYHQKIDDNIFFQICFRVSCMDKIKSYKFFTFYFV